MSDSNFGQMDTGYFEEKRDSAISHVGYAKCDADRAAALIAAMQHATPTKVDHKQVHDELLSAQAMLDTARRDFEKARWAAAEISSSISFNDWLGQQGYPELIISDGGNLVAMDRGHLDMKRLGELLIEAAKQPRNDNGMVISATGALTIAARTLSELAEPLDENEHNADELRDTHRERLEEAQPRQAAFPLETMAKHLEMLRNAVDSGDIATVGQFFNLYVFD